MALPHVSLTYSSVYFFAYLAAEENSLRLFYMCTFFGCRYDVAPFQLISTVALIRFVFSTVNDIWWLTH